MSALGSAPLLGQGRGGSLTSVEASLMLLGGEITIATLGQAPRGGEKVPY